MTDVTDPTISVDRDGNNNIRVTIWTDIGQGEAMRVTLNPGRALSLLRDLANTAASAVPAAAAAIATGECATCGNVRMVDVEKRGRSVREHCPDCSERHKTATRPDFPPRPIIGGLR